MTDRTASEGDACLAIAASELAANAVRTILRETEALAVEIAATTPLNPWDGVTRYPIADGRDLTIAIRKISPFVAMKLTSTRTAKIMLEDFAVLDGEHLDPSDPEAVSGAISTWRRILAASIEPSPVAETARRKLIEQMTRWTAADAAIEGSPGRRSLSVTWPTPLKPKAWASSMDVTPDMNAIGVRTPPDHMLLGNPMIVEVGLKSALRISLRALSHLDMSIRPADPVEALQEVANW